VRKRAQDDRLGPRAVAVAEIDRESSLLAEGDGGASWI
jgi:hypothetical protein